MPRCGIFSHCDAGSHILFPTITLKMDDSRDFIVSYKPIIDPDDVEFDYVEPICSSARVMQTRSSLHC